MTTTILQFPETNHNESTFPCVMDILHAAIADHAFPGATLAVTLHGKLELLSAVGNFMYDSNSPRVSIPTPYDLASLTKVIATTTMAMLLYERVKLDLQQPVFEILPEFASSSDPARKQVTFRMLLAHCSGLPDYERLFEHAQGREDVLSSALALPLRNPPMTRAEYSDIGFIILGAALEKIADESIDSFCSREILRPLEMNITRFCPDKVMRERIPPTEDEKHFRQRVIQGEVHDENAAAMGGVAGHAGLFAPAADVARFAECMLRDGNPIMKPETIALFTKREQSPAGTSRALGWDTPSSPSQSGKHLSSRAFGHLGFSGTSLWIDPERELSITLLTNRTWPDRQSEAIKQVRPAVHDAIIETLGSI